MTAHLAPRHAATPAVIPVRALTALFAVTLAVGIAASYVLAAVRPALFM